MAVNVYVSPEAAHAMHTTTGQLSEGTIVLKEKLAPDGSVEAVGGMVKRAAGFDGDNGNWEYFYAAKSGGFDKGHLANCAACHAKVKSQDYVFYRGR